METLRCGDPQDGKRDAAPPRTGWGSPSPQFSKHRPAPQTPPTPTQPPTPQNF